MLMMIPTTPFPKKTSHFLKAMVCYHCTYLICDQRHFFTLLSKWVSPRESTSARVQMRFNPTELILLTAPAHLNKIPDAFFLSFILLLC